MDGDAYNFWAENLEPGVFSGESLDEDVEEEGTCGLSLENSFGYFDFLSFLPVDYDLCRSLLVYAFEDVDELGGRAFPL